MSKIECPYCGEGLTKEYAVKSLQVLAKSEGHDFDEELEQVAAGDDETEKAMKVFKPGVKKPPMAMPKVRQMGKSVVFDFEDEESAQKAVDEYMTDMEKATPSGPTNHVGNKVDSHRGPHKPGKMHHSSRAHSGPDVQRHEHPTNPTTEGGVVKSLNLPVLGREPSLVDYGYGTDALVADQISKGTAHVPPQRNLRMEQEIGLMENTKE